MSLFLRYECSHINRQECIPVGCVPAARRPYAGVCFLGGGWCLLRGVCLVRGVGCLLRGVCLVWGGVVSAPGGESAWSRGGCVCSGGVCLVRGVCIPACTEADTLPPPRVDRILDTRLWKYYLGPTSLRPVKTLVFFSRSFSKEWRKKFLSQAYANIVLIDIKTGVTFLPGPLNTESQQSVSNWCNKGQKNRIVFFQSRWINYIMYHCTFQRQPILPLYFFVPGKRHGVCGFDDHLAERDGGRLLRTVLVWNIIRCRTCKSFFQILVSSPTNACLQISRWEWLGCHASHKESAGVVAPEVNLRIPLCTRWQSTWARGSTLALKPRAHVIRSPKTGVLVPHKKNWPPL